MASFGLIVKLIGCKYMRNLSVSQIYFQKIFCRGKKSMSLVGLGVAVQ
jgi:hypothetical protein